MDKNKVAFIICVNDDIEFAECSFYLNRLRVPEHFKTDIISVRDADSMAAGYNAAMESSDAKYKIYLHQDTFIWREDFLMDMIETFREHPEVGIMGVVGVAADVGRGDIVSLYDTGKVIHNLIPMYFDCDSDNASQPIDKYLQAYVNALDGLILMTQYDVRWREDLFDGWDFYDASQCMEFMRRGYKVAVINQLRAGVLHDCTASKFENYADYQRRYICEYFPATALDMPVDTKKAVNDFDEKISKAKTILTSYIAAGDRKSFHLFFENEVHQGYVRFRELELISRIDVEEKKAGVRQSIWLEGAESYEQVWLRLRILKFIVWRIAFGADDTKEAQVALTDFSDIALQIVRDNYVSAFLKKI